MKSASMEHVKVILTVFEQAGFEARLAGGCVRDRLLGIEPKDYDIAVSARPDEVCSLFKQKGWRFVPTGIEHGTVSLIYEHVAYEITSLRKDVETDGRHAVVSFGTSFEEDSIRRDFTINAMYEDLRGRIYDFHDGRADLKNGVLRFVGEASERIKEDYLRILRLYRFWSRFNFQPSENTLSIIAGHAQGLKRVSQERLSSELFLIFDSAHAIQATRSMFATAVIEQVLSHPSPLSEQAEQLCASFEQKDRVLAFLSFLLQHSPDTSVDYFCQKLRFSKNLSKRLSLILNVQLPNQTLNEGELMELLDDWEEKTDADFFERVALPVWLIIHNSKADVLNQLKKTETNAKAIRKEKLPINGHFLKERLTDSNSIGDYLRRLRISYRNGEWKTLEEAKALVEAWMQT